MAKKIGSEEIDDQINNAIDEITNQQANDDKASKENNDEGAGKTEPKKKDDKPADDPEIELPGHGKVKLSEIQAWKKSNMMESDYRKKTEELSAKEKEVQELIDMSDYLSKHPKKMAKILAVLDEAEEAAEGGQKTEVKEKVADAKEAIKNVLDQIDDDDPAAKILKALYQEVTEISKRVRAFEEKDKALTEEDQQRQLKDAVKDAQETLRSTLDESSKDLDLANDDEKALWRKMVIAGLRDNPKRYKNKEEFVSAIKSEAAKQGKAIQTIVEARIQKAIESKGPKLPGAGADGDNQPSKSKGTVQGLQEMLENELNALNK